jgi:hypothetical protein
MHLLARQTGVTLYYPSIWGKSYRIFNVLAYCTRERGEYMLMVGDVAPDFRVQAHTGEQIQLSAYASRPVVLWFYPRADTGG